jgi:polyphosphate kinase 2 (PPK2 family)
MNPQGVQVVSFKQPSSEELDHTFPWRISKALPERGRIGIFNRSHFEEVVALRVHPEWLDKQKRPLAIARPNSGLAATTASTPSSATSIGNGTKIVKFFLHVSKAEQKRRFMARLDQPANLWKFSAADVAVRAHWDEYMRAYDDAITATSTDCAPLVHSPGRSQARDGGDGSRHRRRYHRVTRLAMADRFRRGPRRQRKGPSRARGRVRLTGRSTAKHRGTTSKRLEV